MDFEKSETELCVPTLETQCSKEEVTLMVPKEAEKCITVTTTNCKAEVEKVRTRYSCQIKQVLASHVFSPLTG